MANKLAEGAVARVEQIGGLLEKVVGKVLGSERLQERGQEHLEHAATVRTGDGQADAENAEAEPVDADAPNAEADDDGGEVVELRAQARDDAEADTASTAQQGQDDDLVGVWRPDREHHRRRYGL